ncbi:hypothetical protein LR48_Vigan01g112100 [Vigna angularis]|uniref:Ubiquitin-like protease family profile domain-containing protein n=1 Tax=Phaseolus angularis TaxID=3914 RepID=A0A0L9TM84_PHAAN|nr:hypothetical protein LR48_Vigan01g112100 [Vigna angularis]
MTSQNWGITGVPSTVGGRPHNDPIAPRFYSLEKQPMAQPVNEDHEEADDDDDPLSILMKKLHKLNKGLVELQWELRTFSVQCHVPLYIALNDTLEIIGGERMLNISCIQLWCMYMDTIIVEQGRATMFGFLESQTIQPSRNTLYSRQSYMQTWMTKSKRELYIAPHIDGGHWQMMLIIPKKAQVVCFVLFIGR